MTKRKKRLSRAKRSTFITPRASGYAHPLRDYWPRTPLSPLQQIKYINPVNRAVYRPLAAGQLTRRPRRLSLQVIPAKSGMHDTPFKRPTISPYGAWAKGIGYDLPHVVKVCVQRKQRREAIFATNGGGSMRRKPKNRRTLRSELRCK